MRVKGLDPTLSTPALMYEKMTRIGTINVAGTAATDITSIAFEQISTGISLLGYDGNDLIVINPSTAAATVDSTFGVAEITGIEFVVPRRR